MLTVFNIQRYSIHDGDGIRTNVFFKGCSLQCAWCNNPESIDPSPSIMFDERLCHAFGDCIRAGNGYIVSRNNQLFIDREEITDFTHLRNICPSKALIVCGQTMSVNEIINEIEKDTQFYTFSGGGVTITGGEPFSQDSDLRELLIELKTRKIQVCAETSLHIQWETIENYLELVDVFLADLKHVDQKKFTKFTGGNALTVLNNFRNLDKTGKSFVVRVPVIPYFNFSEAELHAIIDFAAELKNATQIDFIPFHSLAKEKYSMLGKDYIFKNAGNVEKTDLIPYIKYSEEKGLTAKILN
jgi:pyruvate formate lyase activating enzyme